MRRFVLALALVIAVLGFTVSTTKPAQAATQEDFYHLKKSQRANMLTYSDWKCNGRGFEFIGEGERNQEIDVRSVWIPKGYSLWTFNSAGLGLRLEYAKRKSKCFSFSGYPGNHFLAAFAKGANFKAGV